MEITGMPRTVNGRLRCALVRRSCAGAAGGWVLGRAEPGDDEPGDDGPADDGLGEVDGAAADAGAEVAGAPAVV
ncbi:MAG: hypothetical protein QM582_11440, partial [Micropruina sp.]|uniref:hypothetical protein n=1 Tax=Micropruina sp. TaxID=2737536 RepID=UPI0039E4D1F2